MDATYACTTAVMICDKKKTRQSTEGVAMMMMMSRTALQIRSYYCLELLHCPELANPARCCSMRNFATLQADGHVTATLTTATQPKRVTAQRRIQTHPSTGHTQTDGSD